MAKLLYNRLQGAGGFSNSAFVEIQVDDSADKIAQHLASALKGFGATAEASEGAPVLSQRLHRFVEDKKLLYILDNVWTASQLTALLPTRWGEGSVVIVTTRFESFPDSDNWPQVCRCVRIGARVWYVANVCLPAYISMLLPLHGAWAR
jgi:hypothetical protein